MNPNNKKFDPGLIFVGIIILILAGLTVFLINQLQTNDVADRAANGKDIPVLLIVQNNNHILLSHLLFLNPKTHRMALIDIPENLGAIIGALGRVDSLDALYNEKGRDGYMKYLGQLLGIEIPFWMDLPLDEVRNLADFLNGLPIFTADAIDLTAQDGKLFRIPAGNKILDGDKTADFLSVVIPAERDIEKNNRRWAFTKALLTRLVEFKAQVSNGTFMNYLTRFIPTNLDTPTLISYITLLGEANFDSMITQRILGNTRTVETAGGSKKLLFPHFEGQLVKDSLRQVLTNLALVEDSRDGNPVRIEVLNATDQPGLARRAGDLYQNYGYQVVKLGNSTTVGLSQTQIIDHKNNPGLAERVAKVIRAKKIVKPAQAAAAATGSDDADITILLGKDFDGWYVK